MCGSDFCALTVNAYRLYAVSGPYRLHGQGASENLAYNAAQKVLPPMPDGMTTARVLGYAWGCPVDPLLAALLPDTATHDLHVDFNLDAGSDMSFDLILLFDLIFNIRRCVIIVTITTTVLTFIFFGVNEYVYVYIWCVCECGVLFGRKPRAL
jgi:hypothetical protein